MFVMRLDAAPDASRSVSLECGVGDGVELLRENIEGVRNYLAVIGR